MKIHTITTFALGFVLAGTSLTSREIGFVEKFSLADNREEALKELVSGTPEYYYYSCLNALRTSLSTLDTRSSFTATVCPCSEPFTTSPYTVA